MKVPIQNKIQPCISERQAQVQIPRYDRHDLCLVSNCKENGGQDLYDQNELNLPHFVQVDMKRDGFVEPVNLGQQQSKRKRSFCIETTDEY